MSPQKNTTSTDSDSATRTDSSATDSTAQTSTQNRALSPEFFDLISEADPHADGDEFYVASPDFTDLHSEIRGGLLRGVLIWSAGLTIVVAAVIIYLST